MQTSIDFNNMDIGDVFDLSTLDRSINLNLSFDPEYNINIDNSICLDNNNNQFDLIETVLWHYIRHSITLVCLEDTLKLMNLARGSKVELPATKYHILKIVEEQARINLQRNYHIHCSKCGIYSKGYSTKHGIECYKCKKILFANEYNFFIYMPIENQLIQSLKLNWSLIERYNSNHNDKTDIITDVHDAVILKKLYDQFSKSGRNVISLTLNTDGANKFKSNSCSVWPIQIIQNFLPPEQRYKPINILTIGLYYGKHKPNCIEYFDPLAIELKELMDRGVSVTIQNELYQFHPVISHCVVDLPAKRMLQCIKQYNGRNACTFCMHPGSDVQVSRNFRVIRYTNEEYSPRSNRETLKAMNKASFDTNSNDGVMGISCLVSVPKFQIIKGFGIDYMHCVLLGVFRKLLDFYINPKNHKRCFYLKKQKLALLESKLMSIKPIHEIIRKPRPFKDRANYKANEIRSILLYYFPVCLIGVLPQKSISNCYHQPFTFY